MGMSEGSTRLQFTQKDIVNVVMVILSAFIYAFGITVFAGSGNLYPGGFSGIARLLSMVLEDYGHIHISFGVIYFALNVVVTIISRKSLGKKFLLYSVLWFTFASIFSSILEFETITEDILLIAIFGGLVNGFAVGLCLRFDASTGGTDFLAIDLATRLNHETWNYILLLNVVVLAIAGMVYGWNTALYSMIFQYVSMEVVSAMHRRYKIAALSVVTDHGDEICEAVFGVVNHGITRLQCRGGYSHKEHEMLQMTVNENQIRDVQKVIHEVDPNAFITISSVKRVVGKYRQQPIE